MFTAPAVYNSPIPAINTVSQSSGGGSKLGGGGGRQEQGGESRGCLLLLLYITLLYLQSIRGVSLVGEDLS